jgi:hypothetical protein
VSDNTAQRRAALVEELRSLGVWAGLEEEERERRFAAYAADQWIPAPVGMDDDGVMCDGEALAEGDVEVFFDDVRRELAQVGYSLPAVRRDGEGVWIGDRFFEIWPAGHDDWGDASFRTLGAVNHLLERAGNPNRMAVAYAGGNDGMAWAMRPEVADAVNASGAWDPREQLDIAPPLAPSTPL